jgi:hypothetical protein
MWRYSGASLPNNCPKWRHACAAGPYPPAPTSSPPRTRTRPSTLFWKRIGMPLLGLIVALLALAVAGAIYQAIATERAERAYPPPGEVVVFTRGRLAYEARPAGAVGVAAQSRVR